MQHLRNLPFFLGLLLAAHIARADVPGLVNYQGLLLDANGVVQNGIFSVGLGVWTDPNSTNSGTFRIYDETHSTVSVVDGIFNVLVGDGDVTSGTLDASLFTSSDRWLEVTVGGETLLPRQRMSSVAYALQCQEATTAGSTDWSGISSIPSGFADGTDNDTTYSAGSGLLLGG